MEISINFIPILRAIYNEYGSREFLRRLKRILNIDLTYLERQDIRVMFSVNSIRIIPEDKKPLIIISFDKYGMILQKIYDTYKAINYYDIERNLYRRSVVFKDQDSNIILDEIDDFRFTSRRLLKTKKSDLKYQNSFFEKEYTETNYPHINEEYQYLNGNTKKAIVTPQNITTYSDQVYYNRVLVNKSETHIEISSSLFPPDILFLGRVRKKNELLEDSFKIPYPNILVKAYTKKDNKVNTHMIYIYKYSKGIFIKHDTAFVNDSTLKSTNSVIPSSTEGPITEEDISLIINYFNSHNLDIANELEKELSYIRNQILIAKQKVAKASDFFDIHLSLKRDFNDLAYNIFENLSLYSEKIDETLGTHREEPPTLSLK